jgi:glycogen operon protein
VLWTEWNGKYRDAVRRFWRGDGDIVPELASRIAGSNDLYEQSGRRPYASINFITAHDGFTLHDLVTYNEKHNEANGDNNTDGESHNLSWNCGVEGETDDPAVNELRRRQQRNFLATLLLSQGVPMLSGGDELSRTQGGNNNAYCQDNEISWTNWDLTPDQRELLEFASRLVHIRREQPVLRRRRFFRGRAVRGASVKDIAWLDPVGSEMTDESWNAGFVRCLGVRLEGDEIDEVDERGRPISGNTLLVLLNAHHDRIDFALPPEDSDQRWLRILDTTDVHATEEHYAGGQKYPLTGRSLALFKLAALTARPESRDAEVLERSVTPPGPARPQPAWAEAAGAPPRPATAAPAVADIPGPEVVPEPVGSAPAEVTAAPRRPGTPRKDQ